MCVELCIHICSSFCIHATGMSPRLWGYTGVLKALNLPPAQRNPKMECTKWTWEFKRQTRKVNFVFPCRGLQIHRESISVCSGSLRVPPNDRGGLATHAIIPGFCWSNLRLADQIFKTHLRFVRCRPNASWTGFLAETIFKIKMGLFNRFLKRKLFHDFHYGLLVMPTLVISCYFDGPVNWLNDGNPW